MTTASTAGSGRQATLSQQMRLHDDGGHRSMTMMAEDFTDEANGEKTVG